MLSDNQHIDTIQSINILLDAFASEIDDNLIISINIDDLHIRYKFHLIGLSS